MFQVTELRVMRPMIFGQVSFPQLSIQEDIQILMVPYLTIPPTGRGQPKASKATPLFRGLCRAADTVNTSLLDTAYTNHSWVLKVLKCTESKIKSLSLQWLNPDNDPINLMEIHDSTWRIKHNPHNLQNHGSHNSKFHYQVTGTTKGRGA